MIPTVKENCATSILKKEESHTQGWREKFEELPLAVAYMQGNQKIVDFDYLKEQMDVVVKPFIEEACKEAVREHDAKWHPIVGNRLANLHDTAAFEAGRLQGIADAVAVVPKADDTISEQLAASEGAFNPTEAQIAGEQGWNDCRRATLTALSALTSKK